MAMESPQNQDGYVLHDYAIGTATTHVILYTLFFLSGVSALIYQIMWQRMLFTIFGVDLTSITIIISVFMFGLGIGGLLGGYIADIMTKRLLILYVCIELGIALFGFVSTGLINGLGNVLFSANEWVTAVACFLMLAFPTILMGATFPILVTHVNLHYQNIGKSVGNLYFANTMGAAVGAYFSGFILLSLMGLSGSVNRAAILNLVIAGVAYIAFRNE
jgi:predicted membrane-bound spermidine synthase